MEDGICVLSQEDSSIFFPFELESDGAHPTERTLDHEGFDVLIINDTPLPLDLLLVAHVVVVVNRFSWCREVALQTTKVVELLF